MEMEYLSSDTSRDLERANAYWKVTSWLFGLEVHWVARSSRREGGGIAKESFSSSCCLTSRCIALDVLMAADCRLIGAGCRGIVPSNYGSSGD